MPSLILLLPLGESAVHTLTNGTNDEKIFLRLVVGGRSLQLQSILFELRARRSCHVVVVVVARRRDGDIASKL